MKSSHHNQKSLKPLLSTGTAVYSAFWDPLVDPHREADPDWYPGIVASYRVCKKNNNNNNNNVDAKYGRVRYYNVHFDDGDEMAGVPDHFVMAAEEYLLSMKDDDDDDDDDSQSDGEGSISSNNNNSSKRSRRSWMGVTNVTDRTSHDMWAKHIGWYVATTVDGAEHTFSLLSDALRAYDASVVRRRGQETLESELNLPGDWERLFRDVHPKQKKKKNNHHHHHNHRGGGGDDNKAEVASAVKEAIDKEHKRHTLEIDRLTKTHKDIQEIAVINATSKERRLGREAQHVLKRTLNFQHLQELEEIRHQSDGDLQDLRDLFKEQKRMLEEELVEVEERGRREREELLREQQQLREEEEREKEKKCFKPLLEVGEEVYAAWWPDKVRKDAASWYSGRVKSYREVTTNNNDSGGGEYGPTRMYKIKYDDDGTELNDIADHFVFPKADYLLSTKLLLSDNGSSTSTSKHANVKKWKGVNNVVNKNSCDEWAKVVGWYVATIDGEEMRFPRLSEALRAYDASIVRRKGNKTRQSDLNLVEDWEWLFCKNGIKETVMYTEEQLEEEKEVLKNDLDKKHAELKSDSEKKHAKLKSDSEKKHAKLKNDLEKKHNEEMEAAIKEAVEMERTGRTKALVKQRKDMKDQHEKEMAQEVEEAATTASNEAIRMMEDAVAKAEREAMKKLRKDWKNRCEREKEKGIADAKKQAQHEAQMERDVVINLYLEKEKSRAVREAIAKANEKSRMEHDWHVEKLTEELQQEFHHQKDKALYWLRIENQQQQVQIGVLRLKAELLASSRSSDVGRMSVTRGNNKVKRSLDLEAATRESRVTSCSELEKQSSSDNHHHQVPAQNGVSLKLSRENQQKNMQRENHPSPPPAKRSKVSHHGNDKCFSQEITVGSVTPSESGDIMGTKNLPKVAIQLPFTYGTYDNDTTCNEKLHQENSILTKSNNNDQSAGEGTMEDSKREGSRYNKQSYHHAVAALLGAAEMMEPELISIS